MTLYYYLPVGFYAYFTNEEIILTDDAMNTKENGYQTPSYTTPVKRYCQMLDLKDDPELITEYKERHSPTSFWKEIGKGILSVGILNMEIYLHGNRLFMIVETPLDFEWESAFQKLATLPRQEEWERYMSIFQDADADASSNEKWQLMEQIFSLPKAME